jgi:hypothetical protein
MAITSARRTGYAICLILTILLVGLHLAGKNWLIKLLMKVITLPKIGETRPGVSFTSKKSDKKLSLS